ncbi:hypothetical protein F406_gp086 [Agrobacterium phage 7-7-1]|uniref:Putative membrane protein n=1 Tax=Agrobacterium phage 7-7-1 TaxID=1161931 RepID=J7FA61_9CAUD|nr:hypothetical protein F406_gp086 [Agrobacterium phage 7-7-1]AFH19729.1 putative membrane protein [Agrobacterium phage 7-7-1]
MPDKPPVDVKNSPSLFTTIVGFGVVGFIVGTLLFHVTNTSSKLISIEFKLNRIERLIKENQK